MPAASDKVYETLKQRLVGGSYAPGAQLKEEHIARELGVSRTPVRAALKRLTDDGLATSSAGRGVHVAEWTEADISETYQLRGVLEAYAAQLAAERGDKRLTAELTRLNGKMAEAIAAGGTDMVEKVQAINSRFHRAVLEASGSPRLKILLESIVDMPIVVRSFFISTKADMQQSLQHHVDLASAIASRDGDLARNVMQVHLRIAARRFTARRAEFVNRNPPTGPGAGAQGGPIVRRHRALPRM